MQLTARFPTFFLINVNFCPFIRYLYHISDLFFGYISQAKPRKDNPQRNADSGHP